MTETYFEAFVILLVVINPVAVVPIFLALTKSLDAAEGRRIAFRASIIAAVILIAFGFGGERLLDALGIALPSLRIAGGALLFLIAVNMLMGQADADGPSDTPSHHNVAVFPLAIPLIAGPGAITTVMLLKSEFPAAKDLAVIALLLVAVVAITCVSLLSARFLMRILGETGTDVLTRIFGIILAALAVEFLVVGIKASFGLA
jgi:multiple antibiotic resistance protein